MAEVPQQNPEQNVNPVIVRSPLPGTPQQVFALLTESEHLTKWFCDACESDPRLGGEVHAGWIDEEGESWDRVGVWQDFEPPSVNGGGRATLRWLAVNDESQPEDLKFALAPHPLGSMLIVMSPLPQVETPVRREILEEAAQKGWQQCFQALEHLLNAQK